MSSLSPRDIVSELNRHIVGQENAKKAVALALRNPAFKTSTLQDLEKGRPLEIEPIFAAAAAVGHARGVPCPMLDLAVEILRHVDRAHQSA